ncbi:COG2159 Predicted metal-dependent hydrolase of the TIM-barrel fold [Acidimicrobiia bacterium]
MGQGSEAGNETKGSNDDRYIVISADGHAGGNIPDYRPYLDSRWHDEFDAWAADFENPYEDLEGDLGTRNWDSKRRMADLEADGQVAEIIYPNTIPPFYPKTSLTAQPPALTQNDSDRRWAGLQAHNRWLADFCADYPGRRAGVAQINLLNIAGSVGEIRWAHEHGLTGGVLLPGTPPGSGMDQLHHHSYEPIWQVCEELGMPVNHHTGSAAPPMGPDPEDTITFLLEVTWYAHRAFYQLILGGALERHPDMQLVFTEQGTAWIPDELARLDGFFARMKHSNGSQEQVWGESVMKTLSLSPSEYWARQCHVGASFIRPIELGVRHQVGVDRIMWGSDYPHKEASTPYSREAIALSFAGIPRDEVEMMLSKNAAKLYGFDLDFLRPIADRIGPKVGDVFAGLPPRAVPGDANMCPAFAGYEFATE